MRIYVQFDFSGNHAKKFKRYYVHSQMIEGVRCRLTDSGDSGDSGRSRVLIWRANVGVADCHATRG